MVMLLSWRGAQAGVKLRPRDAQAQDRDAPLSRDSAGMLQPLGLNPDLVQPGAQGVLVGAGPRGVLGGVGIVRGVAPLIARPPPQDTEGPILRQGLPHGAAYGAQLL